MVQTDGDKPPHQGGTRQEFYERVFLIREAGNRPSFLVYELVKTNSVVASENFGLFLLIYLL